MCTIALGALALSAVGVGVSVYGQVKAGQNQKAQKEKEAEIDRKNAVIAKENAAETRKIGERDVARERLKTSQLISKQRVAMAANGIQLDSGSALDVQLDSAMLGELDALTIRENAERRARNYEQQSQGFLDQADITQSNGSSYSSAGLIGGVGTLFSGGGSAISNYYSATHVPATG